MHPSPPPTDPKDRREYPRRRAEIWCKVFHPATRRFVAARTRDISQGGALLRVDMGRPLAPGEQLDVAVSWTQQPVLAMDTMIPARVVRSLPTGDYTQEVAVRFNGPIALSLAA